MAGCHRRNRGAIGAPALTHWLRVWESEIVPLLQSTPRLMAITILRKLQEEHPGRFPDGVLRTLQRRIRQWRAVAGPEKEIFFPQQHAPRLQAARQTLQ